MSEISSMEISCQLSNLIKYWSEGVFSLTVVNGLRKYSGKIEKNEKKRGSTMRDVVIFYLDVMYFYRVNVSDGSS